MPRTNYRPPRPVNDNFPTRSRGLKLPGVLRRVPVVALLQIGFGLWTWYVSQGEPKWTVPDGWRLDEDCGGSVEDTIAARTIFCGTSVARMHRYYSGYPSTTSGTWDRFTLGRFDSWYDPSNGRMWFQGNRTFTYVGSGSPQTDPALRPSYGPSTVSRALPSASMVPPVVPAVMPGRYIAPKQIMPEWPDSGYGQPRPAQERWLKSEPPPRGTRERKVRLKNFAIGRTIEWLVAQSTEGLDFQRALFEALPWWRKIALYKAARRLELQYQSGRIVAGRLHYVDLTPQAKAQAIYDYIDEIDVAQAVENVVKQQLTDMFWAEIGRRMGRYQIGEWDDHGYRGPEPTPDWQYYVPDTAPDTTHNHWTYETLVNKRLTRKEAQRIHTQFDQYRSQPYEG